MGVQRDLLPLPLPRARPAPREELRCCSASRAVKRCALRRCSADVRFNAVVRTINEIGGKPTPPPGLVEPSLAQLSCLLELERALADFGVPDDTPAAGAFTQLCGTRVGYEDAGPRVSFQRELVSFPPPGLEPADPGKWLSGRDLLYWEHWQDSLRRPSDEAAALRQQLGLRKAYSDPALVRRPKAYAEFVKSLLESGLVHLSTCREEIVGIFLSESPMASFASSWTHASLTLTSESRHTPRCHRHQRGPRFRSRKDVSCTWPSWTLIMLFIALPYLDLPSMTSCCRQCPHRPCCAQALLSRLPSESRSMCPHPCWCFPWDSVGVCIFAKLW